MTKYMITSAAALALFVAPLTAAMAADDGSAPQKTEKMKGSPNSDGMQKKGDAGDKSGSGDSNGAAAATSSGADKK